MVDIFKYFLKSYEIEHFLNALQNYICNQVINLSWHEFVDNLEKKVKNFDGLYEVHLDYVNVALSRYVLYNHLIVISLLLKIFYSYFST